MKISIIIPVYNVEPYIRECLDSVAAQTFTKDIECILVDDCGTDNSIKIVEEFVSCYEGNINFNILHHQTNCGLSAARNTGIKASIGEYLYFLDSDDFLSSDCIEQMLQCANNADMVQGTYKSDRHVLSSFSKDIPPYTEDQRLIKSTMLNYDIFPVMAQNRLVKRSLIIDNNLFFKEGIIHEDCYWTFFLSKHISSLAICREPVYYYRYNPNSITGKKSIPKEKQAFTTFIRDFSANIDPFASGAQKRLILYNLITILDNRYYKDDQERQELIDIFVSKNNSIEKVLLKMYLKTRNSKVLHLLERIYKL